MNILRQNKKIQPIYTISNFLSELEIDKIFDLVKEKNFTEGGLGHGEKKIIKRVRETNLKWISLDENSNWLFKKIIQCINEVNTNNYGYILKFVEDFQLTEYTSEKKCFYSKHIDCGDRFDIENFVDIRKLSFSIQLSSPTEYEGGDLRIYTGKKSIYTNKEEYYTAEKGRGTIIFFPSYIWHEVTPVTKGVRHSLVSWVQGPNLL